MNGEARIARLYGAVDLGSFRVSAMIIGMSETGERVVLGTGMHMSRGVRRGYVTDMDAAAGAVRAALERAENAAGKRVASVWVGCAGAGLESRIARVEVPVGGRRIEEEDCEHLLLAARDTIQPDGRMVLHAQPAHYSLDGAEGVANPIGLHAEQFGVDIHVMLADAPPVRNLRETVQSAHLSVEAVVAAPLASGQACLSPEERDLGTALVEIGSDITSIAIFEGGLLRGLVVLPRGGGEITDAVASAFGVRRSQAERLKCLAGSAVASPTDTREMVPVDAPGEEQAGGLTVNRAELVSVVIDQMARLSGDIGRALKTLEFGGARGQVVLTGGGARLAGCADFVQGALGRQVRIGSPPEWRGLPDAMANPSFTTLAGLCLYASQDPIDIRALGRDYREARRFTGGGLLRGIWRAAREQF